jgi:crotonobetainyl-CoA:carnitine CoA-transferase CaiB-like acyl-CoA transferase
MPAPATERLPLDGRVVVVRGAGPALQHAAALLVQFGAQVVTDPTPQAIGAIDASGSLVDGLVVRTCAGSATHDWAHSGAMALTGAKDGPPLMAPGAPASAVRGALLVLELLSRARGADVGALPGVELLGERAATSGWSRRAPESVGGASRVLRAADGWVGLTLARPEDVESVPPLVQGSSEDDPWAAVAAWAVTQTAADAADRAQLLGIPAAPVPDHPRVTRPPVVCLAGRTRTPRAVPVVVDLTSLWAGPLCAHLLGLTGARVIKVESTGRPDGARRGPPLFYDLLHAHHESVALDFTNAEDLLTLRSLVESADVVLEASRPRALRQLGVDAQQVATGGATWASITAYGRTGPWSNWVGFGDDVAASAGLVAEGEQGEPVPCGDALADPLAGAHAAAAVAAALLGGGGFLLDVSMRDVAAAAAVLPGRTSHASWVDGRWVVDGQPVLAPRARTRTGRAAPLGRDTQAVVEELA